ncbi:MAG: FecR domain-containing protein [Planctomycetes bacterium]|nr:FecR domain-containing protein [Planctomycetota bacterium]
MNDDRLAEFLADRSALGEPERAALLEHARSDADFARRLKDLLVIDGLLSQALDPARGDFSNRVQKQVAIQGSQRLFVGRVLAATEGAAGPDHGEAPKSRPRLSIVTRHPARLLAAAALIALAIGVWWQGYTAETPAPSVIVRVSGSGSIERANKSFSMEGMTRFRLGDLLSADAGTDVVIAYTDGTTLTVSPRSRIRLEPPAADRSTAITVERGTIHVHASRQPHDRPMVCTTPHAEVRIIGTRFSLAVEEAASIVSVEEGRVRFLDLATGSASDVGAGAQARAGAPAVIERTRLIDSCNSLKEWRLSDVAQSPITMAMDEGGGHDGGRCLSVTYRADPAEGNEPWLTNYRPDVSQDWSAFSGIRFWYRGNADGRPFYLEIMDNLGRAGESERHGIMMTDDSRDWKQISIRFDRMTRRGWQPVGAANDGLTLTEIHGMSLIFRESEGTVRVDQIELFAP